MADLTQLLKKLLESDLQFVVVGGLAAVLHGSSQVTRDLDLCIALPAETIQKLRVILGPFHPIIRAHPKRLSFLSHPEGIDTIRNLYLETDLGAVDFLSEITGLGGVDVVFKQTVEVILFDRPCKVLSLDALIQAKYAMGSPKDIATAKELEAIRKSKMNP